MNKSLASARRLMKVMFSISLIQLAAICLITELHITNPLWAYEYLPPLSKTPEMLEHAAMSALLALICGYITEYTIRHTNKK